MRTIKNYAFEMNAYCGKTADNKTWLKIELRLGTAFVNDGSDQIIPAMNADGWFDTFVDKSSIPVYLSMVANSGKPEVEGDVVRYHFEGEQVPEFFRTYMSLFEDREVRWGIVNWDEPHVLTRNGEIVKGSDGQPKYKITYRKFAYIVDKSCDSNFIKGCYESELSRINREWVPYSLPGSRSLADLVNEAKSNSVVSTEDTEIVPGTDQAQTTVKRGRPRKNNQESEEK